MYLFCFYSLMEVLEVFAMLFTDYQTYPYPSVYSISPIGMFAWTHNSGTSIKNTVNIFNFSSYQTQMNRVSHMWETVTTLSNKLWLTPIRSQVSSACFLIYVSFLFFSLLFLRTTWDRMLRFAQYRRIPGEYVWFVVTILLLLDCQHDGKTSISRFCFPLGKI